MWVFLLATLCGPPQWLEPCLVVSPDDVGAPARWRAYRAETSAQCVREVGASLLMAYRDAGYPLPASVTVECRRTSSVFPV